MEKTRAMASSHRRDTTALLVDVREGNDNAEQALYDEVYTELRQRAQGQRKRWQGDPSLRTTALVHEAYLKLVGQEEQSWKSRSHFFAVASQAMRHILLNEARRRRAEKRGGDAPVLSLDALRSSFGRAPATTEERDEMLVVLDTALTQFEEEYPRAARVVECRFFGGMTIEETAEALSISEATVNRDWKVARSRLYREMKHILEPASSDESSS
jgi:RNA polymerase sigma factor (TIGR02999 family)